MNHHLYQTLIEVRDETAADIALELVLAEPACVAARLLTARGKFRVQAFATRGRVVAEVSEEVLATCSRGEAWFAWRQALCNRLASEHARLLFSCDRTRDLLDLIEEAAKKAVSVVYGPNDPDKLRLAMVCGAELAAVQALRNQGVSI